MRHLSNIDLRQSSPTFLFSLHSYIKNNQPYPTQERLDRLAILSPLIITTPEPPSPASTPFFPLSTSELSSTRRFFSTPSATNADTSQRLPVNASAFRSQDYPQHIQNSRDHRRRALLNSLVSQEDSGPSSMLRPPSRPPPYTRDSMTVPREASECEPAGSMRGSPTPDVIVAVFGQTGKKDERKPNSGPRMTSAVGNPSVSTKREFKSLWHITNDSVLARNCLIHSSLNNPAVG